MANPTKETRPSAEPQTKNPTEWPDNPPLPPRELDPSGEGDALRAKAHPGDDTVFAANADENEKSEKKPRTDETEPARKKEPPTPNDAERSRTER